MIYYIIIRGTIKNARSKLHVKQESLGYTYRKHYCRTTCQLKKKIISMSLPKLREPAVV